MKKIITLFLLIPNIMFGQCFTNICDYMCDTCTFNIVNIPSNQTFTAAQGTVCISGLINGNVVITVNGANVCFKSGAMFQGNITINIISGNVCVLEGDRANLSANVNIVGGQIRDCSTDFNPTYNNIDFLCICDSTTLPIINFYGYQYNKYNLLKQQHIINNKIELLKNDKVIKTFDYEGQEEMMWIDNDNVGHNKYKLKFIDLNGIEMYSNIIEFNKIIRYINNDNTITIYCNDYSYFTIYDLSGKELNKHIMNAGENVYYLQNIPTGIYIIKYNIDGVDYIDKYVSFF